MKKLLLCLIGFYASSSILFAGTLQKDSNTSKKSKKAITNYQDFDQGHPVQEYQMRDAYNAPARINVSNPWNVFVQGTFLYWQPLQENMSLGVHYEVVNLVSQGHIITMDFDWDPAFKVALGFHFNHDDWTLFGEYTRFHSTNTKIEHLNTNWQMHGDRVWWPITYYAAETIYGKWQLEMDLIDLLLARSYYLGTNLLLMPYCGLRIALIDQKLYGYYTKTRPDDTIYSSIKSDSWGVGPRAGINFNWFFISPFWAYFNIAASLPYTKYTVKYTADDDNDSIELSYKSKNTYHFLRPNIELGLGLGTGCYFADNQAHFDFTVGYEFHTFWGQNMLRYYASETRCNDYPNTYYPGSLFLHGFATSLRFDW